METDLLTEFIDEAVTRIGDIRYEILVSIQDQSDPVSLRMPLRSARALAEAASVAGLDNVQTSAASLERNLNWLYDSRISLTHENTRPLLDLLVEMEASLATLPSVFETSADEVANFVDESFNFLQLDAELSGFQPVPAANDSWDDEFEIDAEMLEVFAMEAEDLLRNIETNLEILARQPDNRDALWEIRRNAHTFKGAAGIVGLKKPSELAHRVEDLLDRLSEIEAASNEKIFHLLLTAAECLKALTAGENSPQLMARIAAVYTDFDTVLASLSESPAFLSEPEPVAAEISTDTSEVDIEILPANEVVEPKEERSFAKTQNRPIVRVSLSRLDELVKNVRDLVVSRSVFEQRLLEFEQQIDELHNSTRRLQATSSKLEIDFEASMLGGSALAAPMMGKSSTWSQGLGSSLPQGFDALEFDQYTDFHQSTRELSETTSDTFAINTALDVVRGNLVTLFDHQRRLIDEMQERLMSIRMVEFGTLTTRLQRAVRVTCDEENKKAEITIENGHLEIDTQILDSLIEPLMHLLKNAVVHGIETPDTRRMLGKPEYGRISVSVINEETHIGLTVSDDGRGIAGRALKEKAVNTGLVSIESAEAMSDEQLLDLIFLPGLTTAEKLNLSAGRGVGMSIVKESIESHQGTISIESAPQKGTTFSVRMPLPLAVTNVVLVKAHRQTYAIPIKLVKHIGDIALSSVKSLGSEKMLEVGTGKYAFKHLDEFLGMPSSIDVQQEHITTLIIETSGKTCAVAVDQVIKSEEIVIKPLGKPLDAIKGVLGAAILGSGELVPILDLPHLLKHGAKAPRPTSLPELVKETVVMVVDDSPSVRHMTSKVIEAAGWTIEIAKDGVDALEKLNIATRKPDVILSDIEMPRMDGYELVASLQLQPGLREIPVVFITSRSGEKHRDKAFAAGVTEYLAKPYEDRELVATIKRLAKLDN